MNKIIIFKQPNHMCRPCGTLSAVLEQDLEVTADITVDVTTGQAKGLDGNLLVDVDGFELAGKYGVMATPVTLLVDGEGGIIKDVRGLPQRDVLIDMFEQRG